MSYSLKEMFEEEIMGLSINKDLCIQIIKFEKEFVNKDETNIEFFGSPLLGVHPMRFTVKDRDMWFDDIVELDEDLLSMGINSSPSINKDHKVNPDPFNFSCLAIANKILTNKSIDVKLKKECLISLFNILHYKILGSYLSSFFKYPADKGTAIATYNNLNKKFGLKVHGSWGKFISAKSEELLDEKEKFYKRLYSFTDDDYIRNINNFTNSIKSYLKELTDVFYKIKENKGKFLSSSAIGIDNEGSQFVKDLKRKYPDYVRYIKSIMSDKNSFIKLELVDIICKVVNNISADFLVDSLGYMNHNYQITGKSADLNKTKEIESIVEETLFFTFDYIERNKSKTFKENDLGSLINKLKFVYSSARNTDEKLISLREDIEKMVAKSIKSKNPAIISSVRSGVMLYIVLRTFTKNYFEG